MKITISMDGNTGKTKKRLFTNGNSGSFRWHEPQRDSGSPFNSESSQDDGMRLSNREEVEAFSSTEGEIQVGEELFTELCDAWLKTHGSRVLKKILQDWDKIKNRKPKDEKIINNNNS